MLLFNESRGLALAGTVNVADTFWRRLIGLTGKKRLGVREALIITPCNAVHTHFMRFPIDVAFVDKEWRVVETVSSLRPWRHASGGRDAWAAIELPAGLLVETRTQVGDRLTLKGEEWDVRSDR